MSVQDASFDGDVSRDSPFVEVGWATAHGEGDGFMLGRRWVGLLGTRVEYTGGGIISNGANLISVIGPNLIPDLGTCC